MRTITATPEQTIEQLQSELEALEALGAMFAHAAAYVRRLIAHRQNEDQSLQDAEQVARYEADMDAIAAAESIW